MLAQRAKKLTGISSRAWEHPADKAALGALKQLKGLHELITMLMGGTTEKSIRLLHVSCCVKVTATQFHRVKVLLDKAVDIMDWPAIPEVFVANNPFFNAGVYGVKSPFIVLNSAILRALSDDELFCVLGHELGHIMSGHAIYKTMMWVLVNLSLGFLPVAGLLVQPIVLALREWDRKSELSADRAALLALQSEKENYSLLMKMAGGEDLSQMDINEFFLQAQEYENQKGVMDNFYKLMNTVKESHPFPVIRLQELRMWASSGQYQAILDGNYPRRDGGEENPREDIREGYEYYKSRVVESDDPVTKAVKKLKDAFKNR
jgi:Zn-dependent protease with chaperone function